MASNLLVPVCNINLELLSILDAAEARIELPYMETLGDEVEQGVLKGREVLRVSQWMLDLCLPCRAYS